MNSKYAIEVENWILGESVGCDYERDYYTGEVILYNTFEDAEKEANKLEDEFTSTTVVEYKLKQVSTILL